MAHVDKKSFPFDYCILLKTVWALTVGKIWPIKEHQIINEIKRDIKRLNTQFPPRRWQEK